MSEHPADTARRTRTRGITHLACTLALATSPLADHEHDHPHDKAHAHASIAQAHEHELAAGGKATVAGFVGPSASGSWLDVNRAGEGFTVQILGDGTAAVLWFTYPPNGAPGEQAWVLGQGGIIDGNEIRFTQVYSTRGGRFGGAFDPAQVVLEPWGTLTMTFGACGTGRVTYQGPASWGSGAHDLARLTTLRELDCNPGAPRARTPNGARAQSALTAYTGSWTTRNGEGFVVEPLAGDAAAVYWFTYDTAGNAAWLLGLGTLVDGKLRVESALQPVGTRFGAGFDSNAVRRESWGRLELDFASCGTGTARWNSTKPGYGSGELAMTRLTQVASAPCLDSFPAARNAGTWSQGAGMATDESEIGAGVVDGKLYAAGGYVGRRTFQRYDFDAAGWSRLADMPGGRDHLTVLGRDGAVFAFGGFLGDGDDSPVFRYDVAAGTWAPIDDVRGTAASGAAELNGWFYVASGAGDVVQFDPRTHKSRVIAPFDGTDRDHSTLAAFMGELWMMGGRSPQTGEQNRVTIWDPVTETWRRGPSLRQIRSGFATAAIGGQLYVAGGERIYSGQQVVASSEMIAAGDDAFVLGPNLPTPVHGSPGIAYDGKFWVVGGSTVAGIASNPGTLQVYTPNP